MADEPYSLGANGRAFLEWLSGEWCPHGFERLGGCAGAPLSGGGFFWLMRVRASVLVIRHKQLLSLLNALCNEPLQRMCRCLVLLKNIVKRCETL